MAIAQVRQGVASWGVWPRAALGAGVALAANLAVWAVAAVAGTDIMIPETFDSDTYVTLGALPLTLSTIFPAVLAAIGLIVLKRVTPRRALRVFQTAAMILLLLSVAGPLGLDTSTGSRAALVAMHVVTAGAIVGAQTVAADDTTESGVTSSR